MEPKPFAQELATVPILTKINPDVVLKSNKKDQMGDWDMDGGIMLI
jgi:hypothetical protein